MKQPRYSIRSAVFSFFSRRRQSLAGLGPFLALESGQALSALGTAMTSFALIVWSYQQQGSALRSALLSVCSYAPYVALSLFAGALCDRWDKRRTMLVCDALAALGTLTALALLQAGRLALWHLYALNAFGGLMNAFQSPASSAAASLLAPREQYQRVGAVQSFSNSLIAILSPALATALLAFGGLRLVMIADLSTFAAAFLSLLLFIRIPRLPETGEKQDLRGSVKAGLVWLWGHLGVLHLILFLAAINLTASMYNAALPAMVLSRPAGGETALGLINACAGLANVAGSVIVFWAPQPKSRVRVVCNALLVSMGTENLLLALGRSGPVWYLGALLGWLAIPLMNANMNALLRSHIPLEMQGRVYAARNALQFFTIPLGYLLGGFLVDGVFEPLTASLGPSSPLIRLLGPGKGSGAALLFLLLWLLGLLTCLLVRKDRQIWALDLQTEESDGRSPQKPTP